MQDAKQIMEQGWKAREALDFVSAENLLNKAKEIFEQNDDWFNYTECLNHLAYSQKLKSTFELNRGLELLAEAKKIALEKSTKDVFILRAEMSLLEANGNFEKAKIIAQKLLQFAEKPEIKADILSHLSTFSLRTGNLIEAEKLIDEAEAQMYSSSINSNDSIVNIWKCRIDLTKALIALNKHDPKLAAAFASQAKELAIKHDLKPRVQQAKAMLDLINSKN